MNTSLLQVSLTQFFKQYEHTFHMKSMIGIITNLQVSLAAALAPQTMLSHMHKRLLREAPCSHPPAPPALPMASERTRLGHRHLMLENRVHQCVSDPQGKQRQLPFSPSGSPLITDGINPGLMQRCSPADPRMLSTSAAGREDDVPRLAQRAGGRAEKSIWLPEYGQCFGAVPSPYPFLPPNGIKIWMEREIFKVLKENRGGKARQWNKICMSIPSSYVIQRLETERLYIKWMNTAYCTLLLLSMVQT